MRNNDYLDMEAYLGGTFLHPGGLPATLAMVDRLGLTQGQRVLELGCGTGATTALVAQRTGVSIVALDRSSRMLAVASDRLREEGVHQQIGLVRADMNRPLPFRDGVFDAIYAESVIALLGDVDAVARECVRLLRPEGQLAFNERIWKAGVSQELVDEVNAFSRSAFGIQSATRQSLDRLGWMRLLESAGLTAIDAAPVRAVATAQPQRPNTAGWLMRRVRYLVQPSAIYQSLRFQRLARRHPAYWAQQENYLFFAQKPAATPASARRDRC